MATETEWSCPICRDAEEKVAYASPCLHQFCLGCIVRWAKRKSSCPLCRQAVDTIIYSVRSEDDFLEMVLPHRSEPSVAGPHDRQGAVEPVPRTYVAGFQPEIWASLFRERSLEILEPLLPWLNQELSGLYGARWWEVAAAQGTVIVNLCRYGLHEEALVRELQPFLQHHTVMFVRQLIYVAADRCSEQLLRQLDILSSYIAEVQENSLAASPGPTTSPEGTPAPNPTAQQEPQEELAQAAADPSTAGQGRDCSPGGPQRPPKRSASGSQASSEQKRPRPQHQ